MARKKTVVRTVTTDDLPEPERPADDDEPMPLTPDEEVEVDAIEHLLSLGGDSGARYRVDKLASKPGERDAYCMDYTRDNLSLESIREVFGGGTYKITTYGPGSRYIRGGQCRVTIAELPKSAQSAQPVTPSADLAAILAAAKGDNSSLALMMKMFEQQGAMLTALLSRPPVAPTGPTTLEILQMIREMNQAAPKSGESGAVDLLLRGIELGKEFAGGGDESMLGLAGKGIDMLRPLIERGAQPASAQPAARSGPAQASLPAPEPAAKTQPATETDPMLRQLNWLRQQTVMLCHQAARGKNPELYAEVLLDNLPDFVTQDDLRERLKDPGAVAQLAQLNADVAKYAPWFEELRKSILEFLTPDDMQEFAPGPGGHDGDDPAGA